MRQFDAAAKEIARSLIYKTARRVTDTRSAENMDLLLAFLDKIKGDDVLEKIGNTPVERNSQGETSKPTKRVVVNKIEIVSAGSVK